MAAVEKTKLQELMDEASAVASPHVDLSGIGIPIKVGLDDLSNVVLSNDHLPTLSIELDDSGTKIRVQHIDGGVLATIEGVF